MICIAHGLLSRLIDSPDAMWTDIHYPPVSPPRNNQAGPYVPWSPSAPSEGNDAPHLRAGRSRDLPKRSSPRCCANPVAHHRQLVSNYYLCSRRGRIVYARSMPCRGAITAREIGRHFSPRAAHTRFPPLRAQWGQRGAYSVSCFRPCYGRLTIRRLRSPSKKRSATRAAPLLRVVVRPQAETSTLPDRVFVSARCADVRDQPLHARQLRSLPPWLVGFLGM